MQSQEGDWGRLSKINFGYEIVCDKCRDSGSEVIYHRESSRNGYVRGAEHLDKYRRRHADSHMFKHAQAHYGGRRNVEYSMKVVKSFHDPLSRQVNEGVRINRNNADVLLNSESEWHGPLTV